MKSATALFCLLFSLVLCQQSTFMDETTPVDLCTNGTEDSCEAFHSSEVTTEAAETQPVTKPVQTTKKPKTTTAKPVNKKVTIAPNATDPVKPHPDCSCDTTRGGCEINCCCDVDCSVEQQAVFTRCIRVPRVVDSDHCFPEQLLFRNNTDYQTVQTDPGVLCVLHQSAMASNDYTDVPVIRTIPQLEKKLGRFKYYSWPNAIPPAPVFDVDFEYEEKSPLWITDNITVGYLELPAPSGSSTLCRTLVTPKYLEELESSCSYRIRSKAECLKFNEPRFSFISSPRSFNFTQPQECTEDICLSIQNHICTQSCIESIISQSTFNETQGICQNVIDSMEYKIYHNGSQGIVEVKAFYTLRNISIQNAQLFRKRYKISYVWAGSIEQPVLKRSGRPGYEIGKPVISGKRMDKKIVYNSTETDWISIGVPQTTGYCKNRYNLLFGENIKTQCLLNVSGSCKEMQKQIWVQLLGPASNLTDVVISSYGDPRGKDKDAWVPFLFADIAVPPALTTAVDIVIVHSLVGDVASPQAKIIAASLTPAPSTVMCKANQSTVSVETSVRFIDKTTPAVTKFAQPPVYEIKLPRDFFYPFLSSAGKIDCTILGVILTIVNFYLS